MRVKELFNKPKIIGVCADVNQGKSMLLYHLLESLTKKHQFNLYTYGLRLEFKGSTQIFSVAEMEEIQNSIIIIDELSSLWDLDNRKNKKIVENSLRLINHNNNILVVCGTPENFKKFISGKIDVIFYKKTTLADCINGSRAKNILLNYKGNQRGSEVLNMNIDECLLYDGCHYSVLKVPYYKKYDSKAKNEKILKKRSKILK